MRISTIIVDDEAKLREVLIIKLKKYCPEIKVVSTAANVKEALEQIRSHNPDLVFLDIAMPGGSGFQLLKHFKEVSFEIIFVTGFNDYALDALKVSAVDYLLKPVITEELIQAVDKAKIKVANKKRLEKYEVLKHNIDNIGEQQSKVVIPGVSEYSLLKVADIIRCEGWQKYTRIYLENGEIILSSYNIGVFRELLAAYDFYAPHKSHLINIHHIQKYLKRGVVVMSDQEEVPVSRRKKEHFLQNVIKK